MSRTGEGLRGQGQEVPGAASWLGVGVESAVRVPRASLVPVFSFGENEVFQQFRNPPGSWVRRAQEALQPVLRVALPLFHGRGGFLLPFRAPIHTVGERGPPAPSRPVPRSGPRVGLPGVVPQPALNPVPAGSEGRRAGGRSWDVPSPRPSRSGLCDPGGAMPAAHTRASGRAARGLRGAAHEALRRTQGALRGPRRPAPGAHLGAPPSRPRPVPLATAGGGVELKVGTDPRRSRVCA